MLEENDDEDKVGVVDDDVHDNDAGHPKQHEDEGVDNGLQEAETGADARNCKAEQRKLSPGSFQSIETQ